jgi:hypothetical protein
MALELSEQMLDTIDKLRRRIHDTDSTPPTYSDENLYGYIQDAVDEMESGLYKRGRTTMNGDFTNTGGHPVKVPSIDQSLYALQAAILFTKGIKSRSDRDNFSLKKPNLSVDTSGQSADHAQTLESLERELRARIIAMADFSGFHVTGGVIVE